jgi:hypothetical protein
MTHSSIRIHLLRLAVPALVALLASQTARAQTQQLPLLLVVDRTSVAENHPEGATAASLNRPISDVGVRDLLPHFQSRVGEHVVLTVHQGDDNGWFAFGQNPPDWASSPGVDDGLINYFLAGPGLGSPGEDGQRESLLSGVSNVIAVRDTMLPLLQGRMACAVVYDGEIQSDGAGYTDLTGKTLGVFGFRVVSPEEPGASAVEIELVDATVECRSALTAFDETN